MHKISVKSLVPSAQITAAGVAASLHLADKNTEKPVENDNKPIILFGANFVSNFVVSCLEKTTTTIV